MIFQRRGGQVGVAALQPAQARLPTDAAFLHLLRGPAAARIVILVADHLVIEAGFGLPVGLHAGVHQPHRQVDPLQTRLQSSRRQVLRRVRDAAGEGLDRLAELGLVQGHGAGSAREAACRVAGLIRFQGATGPVGNSAGSVPGRSIRGSGSANHSSRTPLQLVGRPRSLPQQTQMRCFRVAVMSVMVSLTHHPAY